MLYVLNNAHQSLPTQDLGVTCCACGRGQMIFGDILYIMCKLCLSRSDIAVIHTVALNHLLYQITLLSCSNVRDTQYVL